MKAVPTGGALGAEIEGVDLAVDLSSEVINQIRNALLEYGVIFFRDQVLDVEAHKRLARHFGRIFIHPFFVAGDDPEMLIIHRKPGDTSIVGFEWHSDTTMAIEPPMGSILYAIKTPPVGGDTMFSNMEIAYEPLDNKIKEKIESKTAIHSSLGAAAFVEKYEKMKGNGNIDEYSNVHPVLRTHPETGKKILYVNSMYTKKILDMDEKESDEGS